MLPIRIDVERFFTKYSPDPNDAAKMVPIDYVIYGPMGSLDRSKITEKVSRLSKVVGTDETENPAVVMARMRWDSIRPRYEAWKQGQEAPIDGTPLAAWNALSNEDADLFKTNRIYTVEDIAILSETAIAKIGIPNGRSLIVQAKAFLESADANRASAIMTNMQTEMAAMRAELEEAKRALMAAPVVVDDDADGFSVDTTDAVPVPIKRRGRPPKAIDEAA